MQRLLSITDVCKPAFLEATLNEKKSEWDFVETTIEKVKVFYRGARVTRTFVLDATNTRTDLAISQLPLALMDASVRVNVLDSDAAEVRFVSVGVAPKTKSNSMSAPSEREVAKALHAYEQKRAMRDHIEQEIESLKHLDVPDRPSTEEGKAPPQSPIAARLELEAFRDEALNKRFDECDVLLDEIEQARLNYESLKEKRRQISDAEWVAPGQLCKTLGFSIEGAKAGDKVQVEYFVPGAMWAPSYEVRVARDGSSSTIKTRAMVHQQSGEDWRGVKLELSTAAPLRFSRLPDLTSIRIGKAQPKPQPKGFRAPPKGAAALFADYDLKANLAWSRAPHDDAWQVQGLKPVRPLERVSLRRELPQSKVGYGAPAASAAPMASMGGGGPVMLGQSVMDEDDITPPEMMALDDEFGEMESLSAPAPKSARAPMKKERQRSAAKPTAKRRMSKVSKQVVEMAHFSSLVLAKPSDVARRNKLTPIDLKSHYAESLKPFEKRCADLMHRIAEAESLATSCSAIPDGASDVRTAAGFFDYAYKADALVDVLSDSSFHSVPLMTRDADVNLRYVVVPREDQNVFRMAKITNQNSAPLLPGRADVYIDDEFVVTSSLPLVPVGGDFSLGLGVEQSIRCARNTHFAEKRSGEKVVAMAELLHTIDIEIVNNLKRDIAIDVFERIPVPSEGAEVVVEEHDVSPMWSVNDDRKDARAISGGRRWSIDIAPQSPANIKASYTVKIYANNELVGGNRREA